MIQITVEVKRKTNNDGERYAIVKIRSITTSGVITHNETIYYDTKEELEDRINEKFKDIHRQSIIKDRIENEDKRLSNHC